MNYPITPISMGNLRVPNRVGSLLFWSDVLKGKVEGSEELGASMTKYGITLESSESDYLQYLDKVWNVDVCPQCAGAGAKWDDSETEEKYYYYLCICELLKSRYHWTLQNSLWQSNWTGQSIDAMRENRLGDAEAVKNFRYARKLILEWIEHPSRWFVLTGNPGTGKTHFLSAMTQAWYPWAMYVVASDLESKLRYYLSTPSEQDNIAALLNALAWHPILILDDLGIEYSSPWIAAKIDAVIEFRSRRAHYVDFPTIVATNLSYKRAKLDWERDGIPRTGSRLTDVNIVQWLPLTGIDQRGQVHRG